MTKIRGNRLIRLAYENFKIDNNYIYLLIINNYIYFQFY